MRQKALFKKPNVTYTLGLDVGIASVGWAVVARKVDPQRPHELPIYSLHDFGVHLFSPPADLKSGESKAVQRRQHRSTRRMIRRRTQRIERMRMTLKLAGYDFAADQTPLPKQTNLIKLDKNNKFFVEKGSQNIYFLKYKALRQSITPAELYYILLHSCKHRGYLNKFEEDNPTKKAFDSIRKRTQDILSEKNQTISEAVLTDERFRVPAFDEKMVAKKKQFVLYVHNGKLSSTNNTKVGEGSYRWLFSREAVKAELEKIIDYQTKQQSKDKFWQNIGSFKKDLLDNVSQQRDFEAGGKCRGCQKGDGCIDYRRCSRYGTFLDKVGKCLFYPEETRGYKPHLLFQAWHLAQELSKMLQGLAKYGVNFPKEAYTELLKKSFTEQMNQNTFKKIIEKHLPSDAEKLQTIYKKKESGWNEGVKFEHKYLKFIIGKCVSNKLSPLKDELSKIDFSKTPEEIINQLADEKNVLNQLGKVLTENKTPQRLKTKIENCLQKQNITISENEWKILLEKRGNISGRAKVSFSRMKDQLKIFLDGKPNINEKNSDFGEIKFLIDKNHKPFSPLRDKDMETNPVVNQAVNETRKVLKALNHAYGEFASITIEVGNEVSKPLNERRMLTSKRNKKEEINNKIQEILSRNNIKSSSTNVLRYKLWSEQSESCMYCEKHFPLESIDNSDLQIDHIVPRSVWGDDSINNKVLACAECNQKKKDKLPLQFLFGNERMLFLNKIDRAKTLRSSMNFDKVTIPMSPQKYKYLLLKDTNGEDFEKLVSQALNNTRYIGKWFSAYVRKQIELANYKTKVLVVPGQITSFLRQKWLARSPWGLGEKVREITHFHHAVDAIVLAQIRNQTFIELIYDTFTLSNAWKRKEHSPDHYLDINTMNYDNLLEKIIAKWTRWNDKYQNRLREQLLFLKSWKKQPSNFKSIFLQDLDEQLERRIPVALSVAEDEKTKKYPKFEEVLNEAEWKKKQIKNDQREENLRFPHVSRRINYKLPRNFFASENFGFTGSNGKAKLIVFRIWRKDGSKSSPSEKTTKAMIAACAEIEVRKRLKDVFALKESEKWEKSFYEKFPNVPKTEHLWKKLEQTISEKKLTLPNTLIYPLISAVAQELEKKFQQNIKSWLKEFETEESFMITKNNSVLSLETYYGFVVLPEKNTYKWITSYRAYQIFKNPKLKDCPEFDWINKKKNLFVPNTIFRQKNDLIGKDITMNYTGKTGKNIYVFPNSLVSKATNKKIEHFPIIQNANTITKNNIEILKIDILGNVLSSDKIKKTTLIK